MENYRKMNEESLPPEKKGKEAIDWFDLNETGLYMVENENSSNQGQIPNSYNVKTFTTVENEAILDF